MSPGCSVWLPRHHSFCIYVATYPGSQQWINHYVHSLSWERYWLRDSSPGGQELVCYLIRLNFIWSCPRCQEWFNELTSWTMKVGAQPCHCTGNTVCLSDWSYSVRSSSACCRSLRFREALPARNSYEFTRVKKSSSNFSPFSSCSIRPIACFWKLEILIESNLCLRLAQTTFP